MIAQTILFLLFLLFAAQIVYYAFDQFKSGDGWKWLIAVFIWTLAILGVGLIL